MILLSYSSIFVAYPHPMTGLAVQRASTWIALLKFTENGA
jgi:hypothetical protein